MNIFVGHRDLWIRSSVEVGTTDVSVSALRSLILDDGLEVLARAAGIATCFTRFHVFVERVLVVEDAGSLHRDGVELALKGGALPFLLLGRSQRFPL